MASGSYRVFNNDLDNNTVGCGTDGMLGMSIDAV